MGKKLLTLLLALGMSLGMVACGGTANSVDSNDGTSSSVTSESTETPETPENSEEQKPSDENETKKEYVTVTFKQEGKADVVKSVEKGTTLTDIPTPAAKTGYTVAWDKTDFRNITENTVVNAVETVKTYTIKFEGNIGALAKTPMTVTYGEAYELPTAKSEEGTFNGWTYKGADFAMEGTWTMDVEGDEIVLAAKWISAWTGSY